MSDNRVVVASAVVPGYHEALTPGGSVRLRYYAPDNLVPWRPPVTPVVASPAQTPAATPRLPCRAVLSSRPARRYRRRLQGAPEDLTAQYMRDSGSEVEDDDDQEGDDYVTSSYIAQLRAVANRREELQVETDEEEAGPSGEVGFGDAGRDAEGSDESTFSWSEDFSTFTGRPEAYVRSPGPAEGSQDPVEIFLKTWDPALVEEIVLQTNKYAWQTIAALSERREISANLDTWEETTVFEMYRYFAVLIYMALDYRSHINEYWTTGALEMPNFRRIMSRNRFQLLSRFLHFVDNDYLPNNVRSYERKVAKIQPLLEELNSKFSRQYVPCRYLSIDESLLLGKGHPSWVQCIRTKAARFGIKSFELCEATTGYMLRCILYAGTDSTMHEGPIHGFQSPTEKVVLKLMEGFLDVGHCLVMDSWYIQLPLTRYLKGHKTDVIGTLNKRIRHVPALIKEANERMPKGHQVRCHSGDLSITTWKDVKLVTTISTYHDNVMEASRRAGEVTAKPNSIVDYNKYMGRVDLKDQKLAMYLLERKRGTKWYIKVFRRLLNTSILNAFIVYKLNPLFRVLSHREFLYKLAEGLLERFPRLQEPILARVPPPAPSFDEKRLDQLGHFPGHTEQTATTGIKYARRRCTRCSARGVRTQVNTVCKKCQVPLCIDPCFEEYHTLNYLTGGVNA